MLMSLNKQAMFERKAYRICALPDYKLQSELHAFFKG